ncbi:hypothetical protein K0U00_33135, partial [Paenibacillus sepulcri]|nr:hypothetical protein [Paenibacillus sepulcri]
TGRLPGGLARISWNLLGGRRIGLEISIPVNCTGTLYVPAVSLACVSESHAALEESRDIKVVAYKGGCAVLRVNSGTYYFESAV